VYAGRFVTEQQPNRRSVTFIPVEDIKPLQEPGVYIAVMSQPNRFRHDYQVSYFYVSDLGLHLRLFDKGADAVVSSLTDGKGRRNVEIQWLDAAGKVLARGETDGDGRASFAERPGRPRGRRPPRPAAVADRHPRAGPRPLRIRHRRPARARGAPVPVVRPQPVPARRALRAVGARPRRRRPPGAAPAGAGHPQAARRQEPVHRQLAAGRWLRRLLPPRHRAPADAPTGAWVLELRADPADKLPTNSYRFNVEEFLPERMKLELTPSHPSLDAKQPFALAVQGSYLYGAPAAGNRLLGVVQYERHKNPLAQQLPGFEFGDANEDSARSRAELDESALDEAGKGHLDIDLAPVAERQSPFTVRATLSLLERRPPGDPLGRAHLLAGAVLVGVRPLFQGDYAREGSQAPFEVIRADRSGKLHGASLPARLFRENRDYYWRFDDQRGWHSGFTETDELVATRSVSVPAGGRGKLGCRSSTAATASRSPTPKPARPSSTASTPAGAPATTKTRASAPTGSPSSSTSPPTGTATPPNSPSPRPTAARP
jgi:uncharacterized protein YfaS (alpha-2-macroglobulin family)